MKENTKPKKEEIKTREQIKSLPELEKLKYEIADEIGVLDKVLENGWSSLTSSESGRIGGIYRHAKMDKSTFASERPHSK